MYFPFSTPVSSRYSGKSTIWGSRNPVVNQVTLFAVVFADQHVVYDVRNHDDFIGEACAHHFTQSEYRFGRRTPFVPVVIRSVVGKYHLQSQQACDRRQQRRADGVDVDDLGFQLFGFEDGPERMDDRFERLLFRGCEIDERDSLVLPQRVVHVAFPPYYGYVESLPGDTRKQLFAVRFHAAHDAGNPTGAGDDYFHSRKTVILFGIHDLVRIFPANRPASGLGRHRTTSCPDWPVFPAGCGACF